MNPLLDVLKGLVRQLGFALLRFALRCIALHVLSSFELLERK